MLKLIVADFSAYLFASEIRRYSYIVIVKILPYFLCIVIVFVRDRQYGSLYRS